MAISLALTADNEGATLINYAEVLSFIKENDLIKGIEFKDCINGKKKIYIQKVSLMQLEFFQIN